MLRPRPARLLLALALLCALLAPGFGVPGAALAAEGTIGGVVVGKNGAENVAGTPVTLEIASAAGGQPEERTTAVGDDGRFGFAGVPIAAETVYLVKVVYDGGNYFREVAFDANATSADAGTIEVYRGVRSEDGISVSRMNTLMTSVDQAGAQLIETGGFLNAADRAYLGRPGAQDATTVRFGLPIGAFNLEPAQGLNRDTLVLIDEAPLLGFASLEAVTPGDHQFAYLYQMQSQNGAIAIDRIFPHRTDLYTLYLPIGARLESGGISVPILDSGAQQLPNGQTFRVFTATNIPAGGRLTVRLINLPKTQTQRNPLLPALMGFLFLLGIGLIVVYSRQRRPSPVRAAAQRQVRTVPGGVAPGKADARPARPAATGEELVARKERLLLELVELDEQHEAGALAEDDYRRRRKVRKEELVATLRALEGREARPVASGGERREP